MVQLDKDWKVYTYYLCPANGAVSTQMLSTINGLDSVVLDFEVRDAKKLKGTPGPFRILPTWPPSRRASSSSTP